MYQRDFPHVAVAVTGQTVATTISTSTGGALPNASNAAKPRFARIASTGTCYVRVGVGAQTAVNTDAMVQVGSPLIVDVGAATHWAAIDDGTSVKVNVTPLEDS